MGGLGWGTPQRTQTSETHQSTVRQGRLLPCFLTWCGACRESRRTCPWAEERESQGDIGKLAFWVDPHWRPKKVMNPKIEGTFYEHVDRSWENWGRGGWRSHSGSSIPLLDSSVCNPSTVLHSFQTKRGREICADPREAWVQEYITNLELNAWVT